MCVAVCVDAQGKAREAAVNTGARKVQTHAAKHTGGERMKRTGKGLKSPAVCVWGETS